MKKRCHYQVLGVPSGASDQDVRKAYLDLARELHPDTGGDDAGHERFVELQDAYECLSDPSRRRSYDASRRLARTTALRSPFVDGPEDLRRNARDEFFRRDPWETLAAIFSGVGFEQMGGPRRTPQGELSLEVRIPRVRAMRGTRAAIEVPVPAVCRQCGGTGASSRGPCRRCFGAGTVDRLQRVTVRIPPLAGPVEYFRLNLRDVRTRDLEVILRVVILD